MIKTSIKKLFKNNVLELTLLLLTILKIIIVYSFFQNIVFYTDGVPHILPSYAWGELIDNMHNGEYFNTSQYSLSGLYDLKFHALRPPLYPVFLYLITLMGSYACIAAVIVQSVTTSLIAYYSYLIIKSETSGRIIPFISSMVIFFLPYNFLKSGSLDDAVFMLLFLIMGLYYLIQALKKSGINKYYIFTGILFGFAVLTRPAAVFVIIGVIVFLLINSLKNIKQIVIILGVIGILLLPWLIRNYNVIGKPVYTNGSGRILLLMQSEEFISGFPNKSIDIIDKEYFTKNFDKYKFINGLSESEKDNKFKKLAKDAMFENPKNLIKSVFSKLKSFIPLGYYPVRKDLYKNLIFVTSYWFSVILFLISLIINIKNKPKLKSSSLLLAGIIGYSLIGIIAFLLSRHFYPLLILLLIYSGITFSESKLSFLSIWK